MKINYLLPIIFFFIASHASIAQSGQPQYEKQQFAKGDHHLNYRILYPEAFDANKKYPVLLFLHGAGERGNDNEKQLVHGSPLFLTAQFRKDYPSVIIFPQCPTESFWSNADVIREKGKVHLTFKNGGEATPPLDLVMALMDSIKSLPYSRDDQLYVGGLSMGGMGTFEILYRRPDMFAAAFPICGGGSPETVGNYADQVSLWVFHGAGDNVVLPSFSTEMVIALLKSGADVKYTLYQDANHNSWDSAFAEKDLFPWLFDNKRSQK